MRLSSYPKQLVGAEMRNVGVERDDLAADPRFYRLLTRVLDERLLAQRLRTTIVRLYRMCNDPRARAIADKALLARSGQAHASVKLGDVPDELARFDREEVENYMRRFGLEQCDLAHRPTVMLLRSKIEGDLYIAEQRRGVTEPRSSSQSTKPEALTPDYFLTEK